MAKINIDKIALAIEDYIEDYDKEISKAMEKGLSAGEKVLIKNLKASSPKLSGEYSKSWKGKGTKYKGRRYVGNIKEIKGKKGNVPLSNILEYSTKSNYQGLIKKTYEESINEIAQAITKEIEREI